MFFSVFSRLAWIYIYIAFYGVNIEYAKSYNCVKFKIRLLCLLLQSYKNGKSKYPSESLKIEASCLLPGNRQLTL